MKFRKPRGVLLGLGICTFVVAVALFFLVPIICGQGFQYNGIAIVIEGLKALITFNFADVIYTTIAVLFVVAVAGMIAYLVTMIAKKYGKHFFSWLFTVIFVVGSYVFVSMFFLANAEFNGTSGKLLELVLKTDGQLLGKILMSVSLALVVLSNILFIVHMFVAMVAMSVTDQMKKFEEQVKADNDEKVKELAEQMANDMAAAETETPVCEKCCETVAVDEAELALAEEERKEREMKLFKDCIDSGYFTEYEELEFPTPIEGAEEEMVYETNVVEERDTIVHNKSVRVSVTHE